MPLIFAIILDIRKSFDECSGEGLEKGEGG